MNISFTSEYSLWWILPILIVAFAFSYWRYFMQKTELLLWQRTTLTLFRFLSITLLLSLLLNIQIKQHKKIKHKPFFIFAQDNSASVTFNNDSTYYKKEYNSEVSTLLKELENKYNVKQINFGKQINDNNTINFTSTGTNLSNLVQYLNNNYSDISNVKVLLASDGLYNIGTNPIYELANTTFPINTLQLGDTTSVVDATIYNIKNNTIGFTNTNIPVNIGTKVTNAKGKSVVLKVKYGNRTLHKKRIQVSNNDFYAETSLFISPTTKGLKRYKVELTTNFKEHTKQNNYSDFVIDILDSKRKVAICFDRYHPDLATLKTAINNNINFEAKLMDLNRKKANLKDVNLVIMYQLPTTNKAHKELFSHLMQQQIPIVMVVGTQSDLDKINALNMGVSFPENSKLFQTAICNYNKQFSLFQLSEQQQEILQKLPPLQAPFGNINFTSEYHVLATQEVKTIATNYPLIAFTTAQNNKIAWIMGEGIWRWKFDEFKQQESNESLFQLINQIVQYQALKINKNKLMVRHKNTITVGENMVINAEHYNKTYQLVNDKDLLFFLSDDNNKTYNYEFIRKNKSYELVLKSLAKGKYNYTIKIGNAKNKILKRGRFIVQSDNMEHTNPQANSIVMQQIADKTGGKYFGNKNFSAIQQFLLSENNIRPTIEIETSQNAVLNLWQVILLIAFFMCIEWFLIKFWLGS